MMKQLTWILLIFLVSIHIVDIYAQIDNDEGNWKYSALIKTYDNPKKIKGHLVDLKEEHIGLHLHEATEVKYFHIDNIDAISVKRESMKRNILWGLGIGAVGGIIGAMAYKKDGWFDELDQLVIVVGGVGAGAIAGTVSGLFRVKIPIRGKKKKYLQNHAKLKSYMY